MAFRDVLGNQLNENDPFALSLGAGQIAHGTVAKTSSLVSNPNQASFIVVTLNMVLAAQPDVTVGGVFKIATPPKSLAE